MTICPPAAPVQPPAWGKALTIWGELSHYQLIFSFSLPPCHTDRMLEIDTFTLTLRKRDFYWHWLTWRWTVFLLLKKSQQHSLILDIFFHISWAGNFTKGSPISSDALEEPNLPLDSYLRVQEEPPSVYSRLSSSDLSRSPFKDLNLHERDAGHSTLLFFCSQVLSSQWIKKVIQGKHNPNITGTGLALIKVPRATRLRLMEEC